MDPCGEGNAVRNRRSSKRNRGAPGAATQLRRRARTRRRSSIPPSSGGAGASGSAEEPIVVPADAEIIDLDSDSDSTTSPSARSARSEESRSTSLGAARPVVWRIPIPRPSLRRNSFELARLQQEQQEILHGRVLFSRLGQLPLWFRSAVYGIHGLPSLAAEVNRDIDANDYEMLLALDKSIEQRGASQSEIDELPVAEAMEADKREACSICLERPVNGEKIRRLPCMHRFHQECIDTWLQRRANCPVCKTTLDQRHQ